MKTSPDHKREPNGLAGVALQFEKPDWEPLQKIFEDDIVEQFMWMHEVELEDGTRIHAYKHRWSRRSIHISAAGDAYYYDWDGEVPEPGTPEPPYRRLRLMQALEAALGPVRWPEAEKMWDDIERWKAEDKEAARSGQDAGPAADSPDKSDV